VGNQGRLDRGQASPEEADDDVIVEIGPDRVRSLAVVARVKTGEPVGDGRQYFSPTASAADRASLRQSRRGGAEKTLLEAGGADRKPRRESLQRGSAGGVIGKLESLAINGLPVSPDCGAGAGGEGICLRRPCGFRRSAMRLAAISGRALFARRKARRATASHLRTHPEDGPYEEEHRSQQLAGR
jgi:hypothetical protein